MTSTSTSTTTTISNTDTDKGNLNLTIEFTYVAGSHPHSHVIAKLTTETHLAQNRGGLELLFANIAKHKIRIPKTNAHGEATRVKDLIPWLCEKLMVDSRKEMFVLDGGIRPGILVLINDADWELEGEEMYELQEGDCVLFVSTLHGG